LGKLHKSLEEGKPIVALTGVRRIVDALRG